MGILVTGASGFIGHHLCLSLMEKGREVHGWMPVRNSMEEERRDMLTGSGVREWKPGQALKPSRVYALACVDSRAGRELSWRDMVNAAADDAAVLATALEVARGSPIVYASSLLVDQGMCSYSWAKQVGEKMVQTYDKSWSGPGGHIIRLPTVYGQWSREDTAIPMFVRSLLSGACAHVSAHHFRRWTDVDHAVEALILHRPPVSWMQSVMDVAHGVAHVMGITGYEIEEVPYVHGPGEMKLAHGIPAGPPDRLCIQMPGFVDTVRWWHYRYMHLSAS